MSDLVSRYVAIDSDCDSEVKATMAKAMRACDCLILDDTYCQPRYRAFLSTDECVAAMRGIIEWECLSGCVRVLIAVDSLGKEALILSLAMALRTLIVVSEDRWQTLRTLLPLAVDDRGDRGDTVITTERGLSEWITVDESQGYVFAVGKDRASMAALKRRNAAVSETVPRWIAIRPSGWCVGQPPLIESHSSESSVPSRVYRLPYSLHSSFTELCHFVELIAPRRIQPMTNPSYRARYFAHMLSKRRAATATVHPLMQDILCGRRSIAKVAIHHMDCARAAGDIAKGKGKKECVRRRKSKRKRAVVFSTSTASSDVIDLTGDSQQTDEASACRIMAESTADMLVLLSSSGDED